MDRQIVYAGAIPLDTDQLLQSRAIMVALGYLAKFMLGDGQGYVDGMACTPATGLAISIAPGSITAAGVVDAQPFGSLPVDGDPLLKIGVNTIATVLTLPDSGQFVVSALLLEQHSGSVATLYYNAADPAQPLIGPQGNGQPQASVVQQRVGLQVTAAAAVPAGAVALYGVTVPSGATSVAQSMIALMPGAPFLGVKLPGAAPLLSPVFAGVPTAPTASVGDASGTLATTRFVATACMRNRAAWGAAGSHGWTCPAGVNRVLARLWGAGGGGGAAANGNPGGGGGAYEEVLLDVQPGATYSIQVGSGSGNGASQFDSLTAVGGGSVGGAGGSAPGGGGAAGVPSTTGSSIVGMTGVAGGMSGAQFNGAPIGGAGGPSFGVAGGQQAFGQSIGFDGVWPGGGGGGGSTGAGGRGADGLVVIEWGG